MSKKDLLNRMNYLIGHLSGVKKMIEQDKYCVDVIRQSQGVMAALNKVNQVILKNHINSCVVAAIKGKSPGERQKKIGELLKIFEQMR